MSLQATGLISGFDVNSIIDDLIKAESAPRRRLSSPRHRADPGGRHPPERRRRRRTRDGESGAAN